VTGRLYRRLPSLAVSVWRHPFVLAIALLGFWPTSAAAAGSSGVKLTAHMPAAALTGATVPVLGVVRGATSEVAFEVRTAHGWRPVARTRTARRGSFRLLWRVTSRPGRTRTRVVALRNRRVVGSSRTIAVVIFARRRPGKVAKLASSANASTLVARPQQLLSVPAAGGSGEVVLNGVFPVRPGQVLAAGIGKASPNGLLALIDGVSQAGRHTVLATEQATLLQALPSGQINQTLTEQPSTVATSASARAHAASVLSCGGKPLDLSARVEITPSISLNANWSLLGGLKSASFSIGGQATTSVTLMDNAGQLSCTATVQLLDQKLTPLEFQLGPLPVVIVPDLKLTGKLSGSIGASLSTGVSGTVSLNGGATYSQGHLTPSGSGGLSFTASAPTFSAGASIGAHVIPALQLLFYGAGGPTLQLTTGDDLNINPLSNPIWTITAPLDLDVTFSIPVLGVSVPGEFHVYHHTFPIASGGVGGSGGGGGGGAGGEGGSGGGSGGGGSGAHADQIAAGGIHTCGLLTGGGIDCWGSSGAGALGNGTTTGPETCGQPNTSEFCSAIPIPVIGINSATAITAAFDYSCALLASRTVDCWGLNRQGELGNGATEGSSIPVAVSGITSATAIAAGEQHACAVLADGSIDCWGLNRGGELGNGTTQDSSTPVPVSGITNATAITAGVEHTCALLANHRVDCWGVGSVGQLGNGTTTGPENCGLLSESEARSTRPVPVTGITNATAITAGADDTCALLADGTVDCWGFNEYGQLGNGTITDTSIPVAVSGISNATAIAAGAFHTCTLLVDGRLECWGHNHSGELGNGTTADSSTPVAVSGINTATAVSAGLGHSCAVLSSGSLDCWGYNLFGQLGNGTTTNSDVPVPVSGLP
jgi:alpha-tubulin suppressor-like RCC1 family protein